MSHLKPMLATIGGSLALLALLGISTDAQAAPRKKPVARSSVSQAQSNAYHPTGAYNYVPSGTTYYRPAPGTGILHGGPSAGWGGPP